jgi:hypothetical protein
MYTNAMSEMKLGQMAEAGLPTVIVRPSIVESVYCGATAGWNLAWAGACSQPLSGWRRVAVCGCAAQGL